MQLGNLDIVGRKKMVQFVGVQCLTVELTMVYFIEDHFNACTVLSAIWVASSFSTLTQLPLQQNQCDQGCYTNSVVK